ALLHLLAILRDGEEMQVVIAEHGDRAIAKAFDEAQALGRLRPAVDQVAGEPQPVGRRVEADLVQEPLQLVAAPLQVADRVNAHFGKSYLRSFFDRPAPGT